MLQFPPDVTALYQIVLFVALWLALKKIVLDRFLENLADQNRRTDGAVAEAKKLAEEAQALREEHEQFLTGIRREAAQAQEEIRRVAEREEREVLDSARGEAGRILGELREQTRQETEVARQSLEQETTALSKQIARSLLGRAS